MKREIKIKAVLDLRHDYRIFGDVALYHDGGFGIDHDKFIEGIKPYVLGADGLTIERHFVNAEGDQDWEDVGSIIGGDGDWIWFEGDALQFIGRQDKNGVDIYEGDELEGDLISIDGEMVPDRIKVVWEPVGPWWANDTGYKKEGGYFNPLQFYDLEKFAIIK